MPRSFRSDPEWERLSALGKAVCALSLGLGCVSLALAAWAVARGYHVVIGGYFGPLGPAPPRPENAYLGLVEITAMLGFVVSLFASIGYHTRRGRIGLITSFIAFMALFLFCATFIG